MTNRIFTYIYRKKKDGPVLAYLVIHALSMIIVVVAIVLLAIGAAQVASGQYVQFEQNSTSDAVTILIVSAVIYAIALGKSLSRGTLPIIKLNFVKLQMRYF